ncbi:MAG: type III secretion system effector protein [Bacteroidales bacterium]|nr:type III secretion system effector protein [Bacteroidales bacterium]
MDWDGDKLYYANGVSEQFKQQFAATIKFMNSKGTSGDIAKLHASEKVYYIAEAESTGGNRFVADSKGAKTIYWDPNHIMETGEGMQISPTTILAHEADHAQRYDAAQSDAAVKASRNADIKPGSDAQYGTAEERRVIEGKEQDAARKHGEIRHDQVTRRTHKEKKIIWIPTGGAEPSKISDAVFLHNDIFRY